MMSRISEYIDVDFQTFVKLLRQARRVHDLMLELQFLLFHRPHLQGLRIVVQQGLTEQERILHGLSTGAFLLDGTKRKLEQLLKERLGMNPFSGPHKELSRHRMTDTPAQIPIPFGELSDLEQSIRHLVSFGVSIVNLVSVVLFLLDTVFTVTGQFLLASFVDYQRHFFTRFGDLTANRPWRLFIPGGMLLTFWQSSVGGGLSFLEEFAESGLPQVNDLVEQRLEFRQEDFNRVLMGLLMALNFFGITDQASMSRTSRVNVTDRRKRKKHFTTETQRKHGIFAIEQRMSHPQKLSDLVLHLAEIDALGGSDEAVIRILHGQTDPGKAIIMIPSTQEWSFDSATPNDLLGNLELMAGGSVMVQHVNAAMEEAFPDLDTLTDVLVLGFSQGGLAASAFATHFGMKYPVRQVVTFGSPVGGFNDLSDQTRMLSFEFERDPVPKLDGKQNPTDPHRHTIEANQGNHNIHDYVSFADQFDNQDSFTGPDGTEFGNIKDHHTIDQFLDQKYRTEEYYLHRNQPEAASP